MKISAYIHFTEEQKRWANAVDLEAFLRRRGESLLPSGHEKRLATDRSITVRGNAWFDHSKQKGGHAIGFVQHHYGVSYQEAVLQLLDGEGYPATGLSPPLPPKRFVLPPRNTDMRRTFAYLMDCRGISREVIHWFAHAGTLYEDAIYHNAVFVGLDEHGVPRHAHKRSTNSQGHPVRLNAEGSQPQYSFHYVGAGNRLYVFESPIDLLSFLCLYPAEWQRHSYVALCGTGGQAMHWMLRQYPQLRTVMLCLDNDKAGQAADRRLAKEAIELADHVEILVPQHKDWNDDLLAIR